MIKTQTNLKLEMKVIQLNYLHLHTCNCGRHRMDLNLDRYPQSSVYHQGIHKYRGLRPELKSKIMKINIIILQKRSLTLKLVIIVKFKSVLKLETSTLVFY